MPSPKNKPIENNYYSDYAEEENSTQHTGEENSTQQGSELPIKKIVSSLLIIFAVIIILVLAVNLLSQTNNLLFFSDGKTFKQNVSISKNGELINSFFSDGNSLELKGNPLDSIRGQISSPLLAGGKKGGKITITGAGGRITILNYGEDFFIDENGEIFFNVNLSDLIDLDVYYDENTGDYNFPPDFNYETTFQFFIEDEESGEEIIILAPVTFIFNNQNSNSCIILNRSFINESTHYGSLQTTASLSVVCESYSNLTAFVNWQSERAGNVEIIFGNYEFAAVLTDYNKTILSTPTVGEYPLKIIFTPFKEAAGKKAYFSVNFFINGVSSKIDFEVPIDNLEQCIQITPDDLFLAKNSESVSFKIDVSSCYSEKINISLCDNDLACSGGTEGGINLSQYSFSLNPRGNSSAVVNISKEEIAGVYGIPIYAKVSGASKVLIDEKTVVVEPFMGETVYPERFIVSMIGTGKDSIKIKNIDLVEDVEVNSNICNLYTSSTGIKEGMGIGVVGAQNIFGTSWLGTLAIDREKYSGSGKYQAALFSLMGELEKNRIKVQNESYAKNSLIKQSYLMTQDAVNAINEATSDTDGMIKSLTNLKEKIAKSNELADLELASQIAGLTASGVSMTTSITFLAADLDAALTAVTTMNASVCSSASVSSQAALEATTSAVELSNSLVANLNLVLSLYSSIYSTYSTISSFTEDVERINAASALNNTTKALDKLNEAKEEALIALNFAELSLISASIDSFYLISQQDFDAKNYLNDVLIHMTNVLALLEEAQTFQLDAIDDLTIGLPDTASNLENILQIIAMLASLITTLPYMESDISGIVTLMDTALTSTITSISLAASECTSSEGSSAGCCTLSTTTGPAAETKIASTNLAGLKAVASIADAVSLVNSIYGLLNSYQQLSNDYTDDYKNSATKINNLIPKLNNAILVVKALVEFLPTSILAADWLGTESKKTSEIANYTSSAYALSGEEYNIKRLNGIVGTFLANAFVNGAYKGGVYTKKNTFANPAALSSITQSDNTKTKLNFAGESNWKEDCANIVTLTLPDYKLNLLNDAEHPILSTQGVLAFWEFTDSKVFDVFEEQKVDMGFANSGLKKNSYGVLELPLIKHSHANPTLVTSEFGPFNIPDTTQKISYKYHMKFNAVPQKSNNYTKTTGENSCGVGILRGETGSVKSLPRIILSWDWNSVSVANNSLIQNNSNYSRQLTSAIIGTNSQQEPFIDASQLSILISKKLGSLDYFLETAQIICPINPVEEILKEIVPIIPIQNLSENAFFEEEITPKCYLPLTTREYDGLPALYYYLPVENNTPSLDWIDSTKDIVRIKNRSEFLTLIDFNAFLIRDGYGVDFQSDFVTSFASRVFTSAYSFLNNSSGMKNYFYNSDRFFFSSRANSLTSKKEWVLPDAGKYRIRAIIDFDETAKLFVSSSPSAKIIISIELIQPVSSDYSPLYYTPIDGFTGLSANNNRIGYGSSLTGGYNLDIINSQGIVLSTEQKNSLNKIKFVKLNDFFLLNALPSLRSKIFDYTLSSNVDNNSSIIFTPTTATPILFEIREKLGERTILNYSVARENTELSSKLNSLFILSKLNGCYDYSGVFESSFINNGPDYGSGKIFGLYLPIANKTGSNFVKTIAYTPTQTNYYLKKTLTGAIYSPTSPSETSNDILLSGVPLMKSNYVMAGETPDSLEKILQGVEAGSICSASLGSREMFFWPEEQIFNEKYVGEEFNNKQISAMNSCIKETN
jgi:hypothetical protein